MRKLLRVGLLCFVAGCTNSDGGGSGGAGGGGAGGAGGTGGGGPPNPPSCQDAAELFYGAGCVFNGSAGEISQSDFQTDCLAEATQVSTDFPACTGDFNAWLLCLESVPSPATTDSDCDCSGDQMVLVECADGSGG